MLKQIIEQNALVKLNIFHWHLTDDQGWRIESTVISKVTSNRQSGLLHKGGDEAPTCIKIRINKNLMQGEVFFIIIEDRLNYRVQLLVRKEE